MATTYSNITMKSIDGSNVEVLYPETLPENVLITPSDYTNVPVSVNNLDDLLSQLGELAFEDSVAMNVGSGEEYGLVRTSNATQASDLTLGQGEAAEDFVPTSKALFDLRTSLESQISSIQTNTDGKMSLTGDETISGVKTFSDGIVIGGVRLTYDPVTDKLITEKVVEEEEQTEP